MMNIMLAATLDKNEPLSVGQGALYAILAIVMVFVILLIIIGITTLVFKELGLLELKKQLDNSKVTAAPTAAPQTKTNAPVEILDDDMMAAVLVCTIDYRNEVKKDVRVVSVKEVK